MKTHRILHFLGVIIAIACMFGSAAVAQKAKGKSHTLEGKVEAVQTDRLTVNHGKVEGYMDAMTMPYKVDKADVLKNVKVGDRISATVYDGDFTLYNVRVVPPASKK
ncbi:MAG TPA: copper-binding protein [Candidatus Dormibacteraeota bacterium]|jgi:Cu/Ag efflux protein CusF|nr:copper-binding protein [Candidatus Dormibacteraeota bacterium]